MAEIPKVTAKINEAELIEFWGRERMDLTFESENIISIITVVKTYILG